MSLSWLLKTCPTCSASCGNYCRGSLGQIRNTPHEARMETLNERMKEVK